MGRLLLLLVAIALLIAGCSRRPRANPFDPLNPSTSGRPPGFVALGGDHVVRLRWHAVQGNGLIGFQIFRRWPGEPDFTPISGVLGPNTTSFRDTLLNNGEDYAYRLYFAFLSGLGTPPAEDVAGTGAAVPWLVEWNGDDLVQVTPDNRRVVARFGGYVGAADVAANPVTGEVWVADEGAGRVVVYQPQSGVTVTIPGLFLPRAVAVDPFDGTGWVCDGGNHLVYHFTPDGDQVAQPIAALNGPVDVAVDPQDGSLWVCERGAGRVDRYDPAGQLLWSQPVAYPSRVAVDSTTREGWVTSYERGTVSRFSLTGQPLGPISGFRSPFGVAADGRRGRIWIADPEAGQVIALDLDGNVEFRITDLADAGEVAVDLATGDAWVVLGYPGSLARISPAGSVTRVQSGFQSPIAVSVDPGGR